MNLSLNPFACSVCDEAFSNAKLLLIHVETKHKPITSSIDKIENSFESKENVNDKIIKVEDSSNVSKIRKNCENVTESNTIAG